MSEPFLTLGALRRIRFWLTLTTYGLLFALLVVVLIHH